MKLDRRFFKDVVPEVVFKGEGDIFLENSIFDSRHAHGACTFFALKGAKADGHEFIQDAYERGARSFVVAKAKWAEVSSLVHAFHNRVSVAVVADPYDALIRLAAVWRLRFSMPIVGITGSMGKTSTKETLAAIVESAKKNCLVSVGNYNTELGCAVTLLKLRPDHDCAILEMGISKTGEMERLAQLVRPTTAVITTIAHSHMEGLGSLADIAREKRKIFCCFNEGNIGIICGDIPLLASVSYAHPVVKFGYKTTNQIQARKVSVYSDATTFLLKIYNDRYQVRIESIHSGRVMSCLAASAAAEFLGVDRQAIVCGVQKNLAVTGRFQKRVLQKKRGIVIDDSYNANPESIKEALLAFERLDVGGKKIAVLGDMLELGANTAFWHRQIGRILRKAPSLAKVIFVGKHMKTAAQTIPRALVCETVDTWREAVDALNRYCDEPVAVLVKASHGVGLGNLVKQMTE